MGAFAEINDDGIVVQVQCINDETLGGTTFPESEPIGQAFQAELGIEGLWLQCSEDGSFRGTYPGPGWAYDANSDVFVPPVSSKSAEASDATE